MTLKQNSVCCLKWKTHHLYQPIVWVHSQTCDCYFRNLIGKRYSNQSTPPPKLTDASNYPFLKHGGHKTWFVLCPPGANIHTHIERVLHKKPHTVDRMLVLLHKLLHDMYELPTSKPAIKASISFFSRPVACSTSVGIVPSGGKTCLQANSF